ncbi:hypothetical protein L6452_34690 [Arctium lappa]|uniref:Uncharacterized protein n=1 Tax=Arctium lappa TaxID=4217 RepID=A0ACB8YJI3_ARCLA|nr:hypothetical protein L6452_34690 [Arctium lappa]
MVDRHVARIVVRLGWVSIEKLPDGVLIHELKEVERMSSRMVARRLESKLLPMFTRVATLHSHATSFELITK